MHLFAFGSRRFQPWLVVVMAFSLFFLALVNVEQDRVIEQQRKQLLVFMHDSLAYLNLLGNERRLQKIQNSAASHKKTGP